MLQPTNIFKKKTRFTQTKYGGSPEPGGCISSSSPDSIPDLSHPKP